MQFLILLRTTLDDIPLRIFNDYDVAKRWALSCDPYAEQQSRVDAGFCNDCCGLLRIAIVEFKAGESIRLGNVRELMDEPEDK